MNKIMKNKTVAMLAIPILFAAFFLFFNLGDRLMWSDEGETALLAVNITKFGVPKATYGKNYITLIGKGRDTNKNDIWVWSPWLDEYITALSFSIFGKTTTAARLPFVLIAFFSVIFLAFMTHRIFNRKELTFFVTLLYVTNVAFLLHARQCRYYALICLAQLFLIYGYYLLLKGCSKKGIFYLVLALTVDFYSIYMVAIPNIVAIVIVTLIIRNRYTDLFKNVVKSLAIFSLLVFPWLFYAQPWHQTGEMGFEQYGQKLFYRLMEINFHIVPVVLLLVPAIVYFIKRGKLKKNSQDIEQQDTKIFLWMLGLSHFFLLNLTPGYFFRYLIPLIPVFIILISVIIIDYVRVRFLQYLLVATLSFSNLISVLGVLPFLQPHTVRLPIIRFVDEITSDYKNRLEDVVLFLKKNAQPDESIAVLDPEFPIIFYTDMHVIDVRLNQRVKAENLPDWIFVQSASTNIKLPDLHPPEIYKNNYELVALPVHDSIAGDSRPDPDVHAYFTSEKLKDFKIYKKKNQQK